MHGRKTRNMFNEPKKAFILLELGRDYGGEIC